VTGHVTEQGNGPPRDVEPATGEGYWHGSATGEVQRWRARALAAEAEVRRLRAELARGGP